MTYALGISLTGLKAASLCLEVSANNTANAQTTSKFSGPYVPQDVIQINQASGTLAYVTDSTKPPVASVYIATGERILLPNVDLAEEIGNQLEASSAFMANLKALENQKELLASLFDSFV
ncbi:MAG: flgC 1 [Rickettsiaceae bacterium]|jgi:flagellar basal body rod protein FlgC|nr:flgC 1 [Rickettsiaceae bacterium]